MLSGTRIDEETTEKIGTVIRRRLAERFGPEPPFGPILPVLRNDRYGDDYLEIYIVFKGNQEDLDPAWTAGLPSRISPDLSGMGMPGLVITSWVHGSEWDSFLNGLEKNGPG